MWMICTYAGCFRSFQVDCGLGGMGFCYPSGMVYVSTISGGAISLVFVIPGIRAPAWRI